MAVEIDAGHVVHMRGGSDLESVWRVSRLDGDVAFLDSLDGSVRDVEALITTLYRVPALSIRQPWAGLICWPLKDVENRSRFTHYRGPMLIHASRKPCDIEGDDDWTDYVWKMLAAEDDERLRVVTEDARRRGASVEAEVKTWIRKDPRFRFGGVIGISWLVDCVESSESPWFSGPFGWVVDPDRTMTLDFLEVSGQLGFFFPKFPYMSQ